MAELFVSVLIDGADECQMEMTQTRPLINIALCKESEDVRQVRFFFREREFVLLFF